ncbi:MAG TPA: Trp family transcriptional regulator [Candidatus Paceibacterota bacterium]
MPHVSSKKLKKENLNKLYSQFSKAFEQSVRNSKTKFFLGELLTKTEKIMFAKRFAVVYLLSKDVPLSYIAESLGMSYSTIFRMSLKHDIGKYYSLIGSIENKRTETWKILEKILRAGLPPRTGRGRWKFLYEKK